MFQYDVKSTWVNGGSTDAVIFAGPARIKGIVVTFPSGGGSLTLTNGLGGSTAYYFEAPLAAGAINISIAPDGIRCPDGIYATTDAGVSATVIYG